MSGRPKTQRTREPHEKLKATKVSRVGTVIRCNTCKGIGHNRASCDRKNGKTTSVRGSQGTSASVPIDPPMAPTATAPTVDSRTTSGTQQGSISSKRKLSLEIGSQDSIGPSSSNSKVKSYVT